MPEKCAAASPPSWIFRSVHWPFKALTFSVFLGIMIACTIDGTNFTKQPDKDFNTTATPTAAASTTATTTENNTDNVTNILLHSDVVPRSSIKTSASDLNFEWVSAVVEANYTATLLTRWLTPGGEPCKDSDTEDISIPGLDGNNSSTNHPNNLSTGEVHGFVIQALDSSGNPRCLGGDYFEIDLSGSSWKSRPPIKDLGNGTYTFSLQVHPSFPGEYNLTVILLYRHYQGLKLSPERLTVDRTLRTILINFLAPEPQPSPPPASLRQCRREDFTRDVWSGRWTRHGGNDQCEISDDGRYRCLAGDFACERPWCDGSLGSIESNGWVYSAHCSFKIFSGADAWECLNNRWIFFWGDSNHCDTIRNIMNFILNVNVDVVPRLFDANLTNPNNPNQTVRITSVFNGHYNHTGNYLGLDSLRNEPYREYLKGYFSGEVVPDTVIINSGLHDGVFWTNVRRFSKGAEYAAWFWAGVLEGLRRRGVAQPDVIYRSTVATGGHARRLVFNPSKMEAFNGILLDKLREFGVVDHVVDHYDMTYPWHYDNRCNDGVHYGRAPAKMRWRDGEIGHQYFVDLMLCHVLLNAMCAR